MALLEIRNLSVNYRTQRGTVHAVDNVSFDLDSGQHLGVIGESGCGKSTLMRALVRVLPRNGDIVRGEVYFKGRNLLELSEDEMRDLRWSEIATIPQASMDSLNPVQKVGKQLEDILIRRGRHDRATAKRRAVDLFELVGLDVERLGHYPHEYSGGMKQRAVIAMALALNPSLLISDEPLTALDVIVQHQVLEVLKQLEEELNLTIMLATHDISVIAQACDSVVVMYAGRLVEQTDAKTFFSEPAHPYSLGLQQAFPNLVQPKDILVSINGYPPDLHTPPTGCRFAQRCPFAQEACYQSDPVLTSIRDGHLSACLRIGEMDTLRDAARQPHTWLQTEASRLVQQNTHNGKQEPDAVATQHDDDTILRVNQVSKYYQIGGGIAGLIRGQKRQTVYAVNNISFELKRGESLGLAGESGCGKSTTGKMLVKLLEATHGEITFDGIDLRTLHAKNQLEFRRRVQLMFQNPFEALNARFTIYRSLAEPLIIHGWKRDEERLERIIETLERVNLRPAEAFLDKLPHQLSGGQLQRVVLARALVLRPDLIVADEPVSMLDVSVRAGILNTMKALAAEMGLTTIYISHDLSLLQYTCDRIAIMYLGQIVEIGPADEIINNPKHPYTQALIAAVPVPDPKIPSPPLRIRRGVPRPTEIVQGCPFVERCPEAMEACRHIAPPNVQIAGQHATRCHLYGEHADSPKLAPIAAEAIS
ncbi:MAG: ABC transporter ATP-binding protein [Chloroflexi bacterium]|nr:MAG: ABC transporter ATP-binding protein [Chloroflexota bacterium]